MNSTPHYGYETQISAVSAIDRDLRRVEDKADANAAVTGTHAERIARSEERIACLAKQKCAGLSKCEIQKLLLEKVDKKEGHGLISEECLRQIGANKGEIALLEAYIRELREQNALLREELDKKADNWTSGERAIQFEKDVSGIGYYFKNGQNEVTLKFDLNPKEGLLYPKGTLLAVIPESFRPRRIIEIPLLSVAHVRGIGSCYLRQNGELVIQVEPEAGYGYLVASTASYLAE